MYETNLQNQKGNQTSVQDAIRAYAETAFSKGLAAAIMSHFPIASILAISFGSKAVASADKARELAASCNTSIGGKLTAGRILGMVGKIVGIVMTVFWGMFAVIFSFYILWIILIYLLSIMTMFLRFM